MKSILAGVVVVCVFLLAGAGAARAATPQEMENAIAKAKKFIWSEYNEATGTWELSRTLDPNDKPNDQTGGQWGGRTAIATYALLAAGESPRDPKLARAIEFLRKAEIPGTYAAGLRAQVWLLLKDSPENRKSMARDLNTLLTSIKSQGNARGMYDYTNSDRNDYSHSRAQYGVLGVWAAAQLGLEVPTGYWQVVEQAWRRNQAADGGWTYKHPADEKKHATTPGMTAAAVATLFITQDYNNPVAQTRGNITNPAIENGLEWLGKNMDKVATNRRYDRDFPYVTLYTFERVGLASGLKYIGDEDWFAKGADFLIKNQRADGSWSEGSSFTKPLPDTCFGVLFLVRGRAPVIAQKLQYDVTTSDGKTVTGRWNQRPRDVANFTRWFANSIERDLNWQITHLKAPLEDLLESSILYVSGDQRLAFNNEELDKLRAFVANGGMIVFNADAGSIQFTESVQRLGTQLFDKYEFRELSEEHVLFKEGLYRNIRPQPRVLGLSNGSRELMLLIPNADFSRWFHQNSMKADKAANIELMVNIVRYNSFRQGLRNKGEPHLITPDPKIKTEHAITLARLQYNGNWNPEPAGFSRLQAHMHNADRIGLSIETVKLGDGKLANHKIAHITGTNAVQLTDDARADLKAFVDSGGVLIVDAAGGNPEFAARMRDELNRFFPGKSPVPLPASHALYTGLKNVSEDVFRLYARKRIDNSSTPRLKGITIDGKLRVVFSEEDLSTALVGTYVDGVMGYAPDYALPLMANVLRNAAGMPPATAPASPPASAPQP